MTNARRRYPSTLRACSQSVLDAQLQVPVSTQLSQQQT